MRYGFLCFVCSIVLLPWDVACFGFIRDFFFPRKPILNKIRRPEEAQALGYKDAVFDSAGLIERNGYTAEAHNVTTLDGYNIVFFRISGSPGSPPAHGKPVVFLQHGIFASSDVWLAYGPGKDLAYLLAEEGYDIWLGNIRGNTYARSHVDLSPQDREFWNFSFHQMGVSDLPTMIDYVLQRTGEKKLVYVGHSMGTTIAYILLSEMPEYNEKINLVVSFAPVAYWKRTPNAMTRLAAQNGNLIKKVFDAHGIYEVLPQTTNNARLSRSLCSDQSLTQPACIMIFSLLGGHDPQQLNSTLLPLFLSYFPAGGSTSTLVHYQQNILSGTFQKFDLGYTENFRLYRRKKPPMYDVKKISAPVALFYGKNDAVSIQVNIAELAKRLRNVVTFEAVPLDSFNHFDFIWAIDAKELLYNRVIELIKMYSK